MLWNCQIGAAQVMWKEVRIVGSGAVLRKVRRGGVVGSCWIEVVE